MRHNFHLGYVLPSNVVFSSDEAFDLIFVRYFFEEPKVTF